MLLLVEGTQEADADTIDDTLPMNQQIFKVKSPSARCILSDPAAQVIITGYCGLKKMMQYRLDKDMGLVLVSAVMFSAAPEAPCIVAVEHMQKVSEDEASALKISMTDVWKSVLTPDLCKPELQSADDRAC